MSKTCLRHDGEGNRSAHAAVEPLYPQHRDDGWWALAQRRAHIALRIAAAVSSILHAGMVLAFVGWSERAQVGAIPQPSEAVTVEMVASQTLEALQPKPASEPAPAPEATAPVEGRTEPSHTPAKTADPTPKPEPQPEPVEPPPLAPPDPTEPDTPAAPRQADTPTPAAPPIPQPAESPTPTEPAPAPPRAKVAEDKPPAKPKDRKKPEKKKATERAPKGGLTSKARAGKGTGSQRASASSGSILSYAAHVRARVAANKPSGGGLRGTAVVAFGLTRSGALAFASLARSSGNATLDRLALAAVRGASPFPPPPAGATSAQLRFSIPFYFE